MSPNLANLAIVLRNFKTLAHHYGQWKSIKTRMALDRDGNPIPWYTYPAIEYLNNFDFTQSDVFEFGSGNSSLYWSSRAKSVVSVEDNTIWYEVVKKNIRDNQALIHRTDESGYVGALTEQNRRFDVIVIDGNHRLACTIESMKMINEDGIILLDNSDRVLEKECCKLLRNNEFIQVDFSGFGPINGYCWSTSLFFKSFKFFSANYSGPTPIGGLDNGAQHA